LLLVQRKKQTKTTTTTTITQVEEALPVVQQLLRVVVPERLNLNAKQVLAANGQLVKDAVAANGLWLGEGCLTDAQFLHKT
jgi:hypothetical protein